MRKENKMGVMPMGRLIISMSLPMMVSMLVQALYNVVDSFWVSKVSEEAFTAVSLAFPIQNLMIGFATGTGVGVNALLSRSLGEKNYKKANTIATNGIFLAMVTALLFLLFGLFGTKLFFRTQLDASETQVFQDGVDYLSICCIFSFGVFGQVMLERLMQATGRTTLSMVTQLIGALINIIFDPILILGLGFFPRMEAAGAAVATVLGQIVAFFAGIILNARFNKEIKTEFKGFRPNLALIKEIYKIGVPSIIMVAIGSVMTYLLNLILLGFTRTAAAVLGAYFKLQSFVFMPVFGLNNGVIPIIAYNYGAKQKDRMIKAVKISTVLAFCIMLVGTMIMQLCPEAMLKIFEASDDMLSMGVTALRILSLPFCIAGVNICLGSIFQALGKSYFSMIISFARQLVVLIPAAYLLSLLGNVDYVWYAFPVAEVVSCAVTFICFSFVYKKIIKPMQAA